MREMVEVEDAKNVGGIVQIFWTIPSLVFIIISSKFMKTHEF